jgi:hypothetical protein
MYAQDDYRLRPNLTLNYGLRYSLFRQPTDAQDHATSFDPARYNPANTPVLDDQGLLCTPETMPCNGTSQTNPNYDPLNGIIIGGRNSPFGTKIAREANNGFAPRVGFAWDPTGKGRQSVRGGYGIFVESPGVGFVENNVFSNPPFVGTTTIQSAPFDNPGAGQPTVDNAPTPLGGTEPRYKQPYTQQWNLDVQQELPANMIFDIGYYGSKGTHLLAALDINQPVPGAYAPIFGAGSIDSSNETLINSLRPFIGYAGIDLYEPIFKSNYHSLQTSLQKNFRAGSLIALNYTWSKNLTNLPDDPNFAVPPDSRNLASDYTHSRFDQRHVFTADFVYQIPVFKEQHGFVGHTLGGWELSGIISATSGHWLNPGDDSGADPGGVGLGTGISGNTVRPNQVGNPNIGAPHQVGQWFNTAAFPNGYPAGQAIPGTARRNSILGPGRSNVDLSLLKNIRVTEGSAFQFRLEAFNAINHTSFSSIDTTVNSETYGAVTGAHEPRIVQLALKFNF